MGELTKLLRDLTIIETGKRRLQVENDMLQSLHFPFGCRLTNLLNEEHLKVKGVEYFDHISFASTDWVWVSAFDILLLTDTSISDTLYTVEDSLSSSSGLHTVNNGSELIYTDKLNNIKKVLM